MEKTIQHLYIHQMFGSLWPIANMYWFYMIRKIDMIFKSTNDTYRSIFLTKYLSVKINWNQFKKWQKKRVIFLQ